MASEIKLEQKIAFLHALNNLHDYWGTEHVKELDTKDDWIPICASDSPCVEMYYIWDLETVVYDLGGNKDLRFEYMSIDEMTERLEGDCETECDSWICLMADMYEGIVCGYE